MTSKDTKSAPSNAPTPNDQIVSTGEERKAVVDEIVNQIKKDSIKDDALAKLRTPRLSELIARFFQHPAVLLVVGFAFTGLIGSYLTNRWQSQEWERQQQRTLEIREYERKNAQNNEIIEEVTKAVGEINTAAVAVVSPLLKGVSNQQLIREEVEPTKGWRKASDDWRVRIRLLQLKFTTRIKNPEAADIFRQIGMEEDSIGVEVNLLQAKLEEFNWVNSNDEEKKNRAIKRIDGILNRIQTTTDDLEKLVTMIAEEGRDDVNRSKP